jgi:hypothetical protein
MFKIKIILFIILLIIIYFSIDFVGKKVTLFNVECPKSLKLKGTYQSEKLKDPMTAAVISHSRAKGINPVNYGKEIFVNKKLTRVVADKFLIGHLTHSFPYLTLEGNKLLSEIAEAFQEKLKGTELEGTKFIVTSLTRTNESVNRLMKNNNNAVKNSTHLHGNAFDITYSRFSLRYHKLQDCHTDYLRELLAQVLLEFKAKKRCWALKEYHEKCFHIVSTR